jgi:N-acetylglutamate synthase-like GNAT family acetyltransferase
MEEKLWDKFITYVNAYYAIQAACLNLEQRPEGAPGGLEEFCTRANPFLWDSTTSAEPALFEDFSQKFEQHFGSDACSAQDGLTFCHSWLSSLEGDRFGRNLIASLDSVIDDPQDWEASYGPIAEQINNRRVMNELSWQDDSYGYSAPSHAPAEVSFEEFASRQATLKDINQVVVLLSRTLHSDASRVESYLVRGMQRGVLVCEISLVEDEIVATASVLFVELMPTLDNLDGMVGFIEGIAAEEGYEATITTLLTEISKKARARGVSKLYLTQTSTRATDACLDFGFDTQGGLLTLDIS